VCLSPCVINIFQSNFMRCFVLFCRFHIFIKCQFIRMDQKHVFLINILQSNVMRCFVLFCRFCGRVEMARRNEETWKDACMNRAPKEASKGASSFMLEAYESKER